MKYRDLGATGLSVSEIGLGCEWLNNKKEALVKSIIQTAIEGGINFFDLLFNKLDYITKVGNAIEAYRDKIILQTHLGTTEKEGKPYRDRDIARNQKDFLRTLTKYKTNYVDILNIQYVKENEYEILTNQNGLLSLAKKLKNEGKTRFIGLSTHSLSLCLKALKDNNIDTIMLPLNMINENLNEREELLQKAKISNIGVIGIKPLLGGKLLNSNRTVYIANYQTGGLSGKLKIPKSINLYQCLKYCLDQTGISTIIPGVNNAQELQEILRYYSISTQLKDYSESIKILSQSINNLIKR